jgi:hypothetical protein
MDSGVSSDDTAGPPRRIVGRISPGVRSWTFSVFDGGDAGDDGSAVLEGTWLGSSRRFTTAARPARHATHSASAAMIGTLRLLAALRGAL